MRAEFPWRASPVANLLLGLVLLAAIATYYRPLSNVAGDVFLLLGLPGIWSNWNRSRYLRVDERGVRLFQKNLGTESRLLWHIEPRDLKALRRDPKGLTLVTRTGRERKIRLAPTPFGGWADPEGLEAAIRARMEEPPAQRTSGIDSRPWSPEPPTPTT